MAAAVDEHDGEVVGFETSELPVEDAEDDKEDAEVGAKSSGGCSEKECARPSSSSIGGHRYIPCVWNR